MVTRCNGTHTVGEIAEVVLAKFGESAEPFMPRLSKFIEILEVNDWLIWVEDDAESQVEIKRLPLHQKNNRS
ncbi:hypothetical protein GNP92_22965 [Paenibacillus timonensis]|nr:hypothetical protein [Paenibacillus timonensis]